MVKFPQERLEFTIRVLATRLRQNQSLAGDTFAATDMITVYPTTQRYFDTHFSITGYEGSSCRRATASGGILPLIPPRPLLPCASHAIPKSPSTMSVIPCPEGVGRTAQEDFCRLNATVRPCWPSVEEVCAGHRIGEDAFPKRERQLLDQHRRRAAKVEDTRDILCGTALDAPPAVHGCSSIAEFAVRRAELTHRLAIDIQDRVASEQRDGIRMLSDFALHGAESAWCS